MVAQQRSRSVRGDRQELLAALVPRQGRPRQHGLELFLLARHGLRRAAAHPDGYRRDADVLLRAVNRARLRQHQGLGYAVSFGRLLRNQHRWAAEGMVAVVFIHMARVFFTGAYRGSRAINWFVGIALLLATLLLSFTGYLLPWDQLAFWAITVGTSIAKEAPVVGPTMQYILLGGHEIGQQTLLRFYVLHVFFLPVFVWVLFAYHMWRVRKDGGLAAIEPIRAARTMGAKATPRTKSYSLFGLTPGTSVAVMSSTGLEEEDQVFRVAQYDAAADAGVPGGFQPHAGGRADVRCAAGGSRESLRDAESRQGAVVLRLAAGAGRIDDHSLRRLHRQRRVDRRNPGAGISAARDDAVAVARSLAAHARRGVARARAQPAELDVRRRDARDHRADHGRRLSARSRTGGSTGPARRAPRRRDSTEMADRSESYEAKDFGWMVAMSICSGAGRGLLLASSSAPNGETISESFPTAWPLRQGRRARDFRPGIQQIWIPKIGVTDRCITCHLGYEWSLDSSRHHPRAAEAASDERLDGEA